MIFFQLSASSLVRAHRQHSLQSLSYDANAQKYERRSAKHIQDYEQVKVLPKEHKANNSLRLIAIFTIDRTQYKFPFELGRYLSKLAELNCFYKYIAHL